MASPACVLPGNAGNGKPQVRIECVGGGPGGLYAAILLKSDDPSRDVVVHERNAADDTFGFGVVFSAATLRGLEAADGPSFERLWDACARWDPVEVRYGGERIRARGNSFAAISRHRLLHILQERATELGVEVRFTDEVTDVTDLLDADLVLGADGINSGVRAHFAEQFRPRLTVEGSKFIWLGTAQRFDAFTFIFSDSPAGRFQAHIYPFGEGVGTFIVECTDATWRAAGLDAVAAEDLAPGESDHSSIAHLQDLFADHLDGHDLVANNSKWLDWTTVRNESWRHDRVVLLGDAAHTAHFSIGSGTKLAMEDAMALAEAVRANTSLDHALDDYVSARKPSVEGIQQAASESLDWFARHGRYWSFEPPQFAYSLLTRSTRVDYDNLRQRDHRLVDLLDRWYATEDGRVPLVPRPPALTGVQVGPTSLANRLVLLPEPDDAATDGIVSSAHLDALAEWVDTDVALVLVDGVAVSATGRSTETDAGIWTDEQAGHWADLLATARRGDGPTRIGLRLVHAGPRGASRGRDHGIGRPLPQDRSWPLVAASPVRWGPTTRRPDALDAAGMESVVHDHVDASRRAAEAGFDALEVHAGHGGLLASFLSPLTNRRDDDHGGDVTNRMRFPLRVVEAVRATWPRDRLLSVCLSASDLEPDGIEPDEVLAVVEALRATGVDLVHVVAGQTTTHSRPEYGTAFNSRWSDLVRNAGSDPVLTSGNMPTVDDVNHVLLSGQADLCVLGRPLPETPDWLVRPRAGTRDDGATATAGTQSAGDTDATAGPAQRAAETKEHA